MRAVPTQCPSLDSSQPQLRLFLSGHICRVLRHRGPGHVDSPLSAPCSSCTKDRRDVQQPALRSQRQVKPGHQGLGASVPATVLFKSHSAVLCPHSLIFGAITCFTGFLGVVTGAGATRWCRLRTQRADPLVCAVGMLGSAIFICLIFVAAKTSIVGAYVSPWEVGGDGLELQSDMWDPLSPRGAGVACPCPVPLMVAFLLMNRYASLLGRHCCFLTGPSLQTSSW